MSLCLCGEKRLRRGLTLVELLVVISIMMLLVAFALPRIRPDAGTRRARETARLVNTFLNRARVTALETGRPCGVMFQRIDDPLADNLTYYLTNLYNPGTATDQMVPGCNTLFQVEVPPLYAGDVDGAAMKVKDFTVDVSQTVAPLAATNYHYAPGYVVLKVVVRPGTMGEGILRYGDLVQLGGQGPWYEIWQDPRAGATGSVGGVAFPNKNNDPADYLIFSDTNIQDTDGDGWIDTHWLTLRSVKPLIPTSLWPPATTPWPKWTVGVLWNGSTNDYVPFSDPMTFRILRQPSPTIGDPLRLPKGMAVDLGVSGTSRAPTRARIGPRNLGIMFSPDGTVSRYYDFYSPAGGEVLSEPLFLLVGLESQLNPEPEPGVANSDRLNCATERTAPDECKANWQLLNSLWITISPQSGLISVGENAATPTWDALPAANRQDATYQPAAIDEARRFAKQSQSMGGR